MFPQYQYGAHAACPGGLCKRNSESEWESANVKVYIATLVEWQNCKMD